MTLAFFVFIYLCIGFYHGCAFGDSAKDVLKLMVLWFPNVVMFLYLWFSAKNIDKIEE